MSNYVILNAINAAAIEGHNNGKAAKAVASFTTSNGLMAVAKGKKKLETLAASGINEAMYTDYCNNVKSLYFDVVHIENARDNKDNITENKARDYFFADLKELVTSIMDETYNPLDLFETGEAVRDFSEQCLAVLRKFTTGSTGYEIEAAKIGAFVKWLEPAIATRASGVAMLSFAERDRRANLKKWTNKVSKTEASIEAKEGEVAAKEADIAKLTEKGKDTKRAEKALANIKAELEQLKVALDGAKAKVELYTNMTTEYSADEMLSPAAVVTAA